MVFTVLDFVIANFVIFMIVMGVVLYSRAIKYGKAGPVQSIQEAKMIV